MLVSTALCFSVEEEDHTHCTSHSQPCLAATWFEILAYHNQTAKSFGLRKKPFGLVSLMGRWEEFFFLKRHILVKMVSFLCWCIVLKMYTDLFACVSALVTFLYIYFMCVRGHAYAMAWGWVSEDSLWSLFSPVTWIPGIKLTPSDLAASASNLRAILPAQRHSYFKNLGNGRDFIITLYLPPVQDVKQSISVITLHIFSLWQRTHAKAAA